ncbi:MAG: TPR end-of-group domain-containing protein [Terriglobales bacterium]
MSTGVARSADEQYESALEQYAAAMKQFGQQKYERAKPLLEKVCASPFRELAERAGVHLKACNGRLESQIEKTLSADEYYQHAIVKMNIGQQAEAEELLTKAVKAGGKNPDLSYALACLRAQTHDAEAALVHLKEAIRGDGRCRMLARQDRDFEPLMDDPRFTEILYPESHA